MSRAGVVELPENLTHAQLVTLLNDRFRDLNLLLTHLVSNPADVDVSLGQFKITDLADPTGDFDGVNLRTLKRMAGAPVATTAQSTGSALDAYTIVYSLSGLVGPNEVIPAYIVGKDRAGTGEEVWVYALGAAVTDFTFQLTLNGTNMLPGPVTLGAGANGPVFSTSFAGVASLTHGDRVELVPLTGSPSGVSVGLVVKRK